MDASCTDEPSLPTGVSIRSKIHRGEHVYPLLLKMHNQGWQQLSTRKRGHMSFFTGFARCSSGISSPKDNCCSFAQKTLF